VPLSRTVGKIIGMALEAMMWLIPMCVFSTRARFFFHPGRSSRPSRKMTLSLEKYSVAGMARAVRCRSAMLREIR
jgi:hypothetical protein